jgi:uncharacterized protein (DUF58 family)
MTEKRTAWEPTPALGRGLSTGAIGVGLALALGRPALVVLVAPMLVAGAIAVALKPRGEPHVFTRLAHTQLHEGQGTTSRVELTDAEDAEVLVRVMAHEPYVASHPADGAVATPVHAPVDIEISPRRWGRRRIGVELTALVSRWGGYRWGPAVIPGLEMSVLPAVTPLPRSTMAPQPLGLIGAHRSRREGDGTEFSSIRHFHAGDRLRRINWRVSLRQGSLHVESTNAEEDTALLLIVDALADFGVSGGVGGAESSLDVTVRAAAAIAEQYVRGGDRVSLRILSPDGQWAPYGAGMPHLRRILTLLGRVKPGQIRDVAVDQIDFRANEGTVVIVLSPMLSEQLATATVRLVRRGLTVVVIDPLPPGSLPEVWPDADRAIGELAWRMRLIDRSHLLTRLGSVGCPIVSWEGPGTLAQVLQRLARRSQLPRMARS